MIGGQKCTLGGPYIHRVHTVKSNIYLAINIEDVEYFTSKSNNLERMRTWFVLNLCYLYLTLLIIHFVLFQLLWVVGWMTSFYSWNYLTVVQRHFTLKPTVHISVPSHTQTSFTAYSRLPSKSTTVNLKRIKSPGCRCSPQQAWETQVLPLLVAFRPTISPSFVIFGKQNFEKLNICIVVFLLATIFFYSFAWDAIIS